MTEPPEESVSFRLRTGDSTFALLVWTTIVIVLQVCLGLASLLYAVSAFRGLAEFGHLQAFNQPANQTSAFTPFYPFPSTFDAFTVNSLIVVYIVLPPIVAAAISSLLRPKHILSMGRIHALTVCVSALLILWGVVPSFYSANYQVFLTSFTFLWFVYLIAFSILGFFQTTFVRWLVGVNEGPLKPNSFSVTADYATLHKLILDEFSESFTIRTVRDDAILVVSTYDTNRVIIGLGPDKNHKSKSILCLIPCTYDRYEAHTTDESIGEMEDIILNLTGRLVDKARLTPTADDPILTKATRSVALEPTRTRFAVTREILKKIPTEFRYALVVTFIAGALVSILYFEQATFSVKIDAGQYLDAILLIVLAVVAEVGIPLGQALRESKLPKVRASA